MLVFAASDKGGTGRSVTGSNVTYRHALDGKDAAYLDFDFGSPTAGAIFDLPDAADGVDGSGMHSYLRGRAAAPRRINVWAESAAQALHHRQPGSGRLTLFPGDAEGSEFGSHRDVVRRCVRMLRDLDDEYGLILIDLSAGRSYATEIALTASADPELSGVTVRWLVFHRWTRQHIIAASNLVHGPQGIVDTGTKVGHAPDQLRASIRYVRTAVLDPSSREQDALNPEQRKWLVDCNSRLHELAGQQGLGRSNVLGEIPLDPVLQWQEQLISDEDVWVHRTANAATIVAFQTLGHKIVDDDAWARQ